MTDINFKERKRKKKCKRTSYVQLFEYVPIVAYTRIGYIEKNIYVKKLVKKKLQNATIVRYVSSAIVICLDARAINGKQGKLYRGRKNTYSL